MSEKCGAKGPAGTGCEKITGHEKERGNVLHHEPKLNGIGGHYWSKTYQKIQNRQSVYKRTEF